MKLNWLWEHQVRKELNMFLGKELNTYADYFAKYHPKAYHFRMRPLLCMLNR